MSHKKKKFKIMNHLIYLIN